MDNKNIWLNKVLKTLPIFLISGLTLIPVGIVFLCRSNTVSVNEHIVDYTYCQSFDFTSDKNISCADAMLKDNEPCVCYYNFNITDNLTGELTFYYELESFDQQRSNYVNSRDVNQLMGILTQTPSENCEPYRYDVTPEGKKPIYPCGAIADSQFNDTFQLTDVSNNKILHFIYSGILSDADKVGYHNPANLTEDLKNFTKPKNWDRSILELDTLEPGNNGFQNEMLIIWMKTEWKRKPYARVDKNQTFFENGLRSGEYDLRVGYNYPPMRYDGRRKFILSASLTKSHFSLYILGIISLVIGLIFLAIATVVIIIHNRIKAHKDANNSKLNSADENHDEPHIPAEEKPLSSLNSVS